MRATYGQEQSYSVFTLKGTTKKTLFFSISNKQSPNHAQIFHEIWKQACKTGLSKERTIVLKDSKLGRSIFGRCH